MERALRFAATLTPDTEVGGSVAEAVGVGVVSQGKTVEDTVTNLREALELYFEDEPAEEKPVNNSAAPVLMPKAPQ
ncbi:type II toxin-antitoxin system HicB family antitoxin [Nocardiopsis algeriensis]|uniref:type II toxin-antitoxin system HicB family antitoxin n=1 Tax=Nocardiopsis algeriensis TaxID=1478215 RepID=UPI003B433EE3